jgi:Na+/proline symporter
LIVAFSALALYPDLRGLEDPGVGFPMVIRDLAPVGMRGLMLVVFFAAFMSTISTQMNWGASYLVSDFYKRFIKLDASDRHLTLASRLGSIVVLLLGGIASYFMIELKVSVDKAWKILAALGAGTGAVFMLRWFWWRINAWTEIAAMVGSLVFFVVFSLVDTGLKTEQILAIVAGLTVLTWLIVTYLTPPERKETLLAFYRKIRPDGPGWKPIAVEAPEVKTDRTLGVSIVTALFAAGIVYLTIPGLGFLIFHEFPKALGCLVSAIVCAVAVVLLMRKTGWERIAR